MISHRVIRGLAAFAFLSSPLFHAQADSSPQPPSPILLPSVVVTAQKRDQDPIDVPVTFNAFTGEFLNHHEVHRYEDLALFTPGMTVFEQSPGHPSVNLRGLSSDNTDPRAATRVAIFQDGVSISRIRASSVELFDLERIEVLKGPQGTLFGRSAQAGAISLIQNKATNRHEGYLSAGFGNYSERHTNGMLNLPLNPDTLFARVAFTATEHEGYVRNAAGGPNLNGRDSVAVRGTLRWQPAETTTLDLILNHQRDQPSAVAFKSSVIPPTGGSTRPFSFAELNRGPDLRVNRTVEGATLLAERRLNPAWALNTITGWRQFHSREDADVDGSPLHLLELTEHSHGHQLSQEVRATYDADGRFAGFFGVGWFLDRAHQQVNLLANDQTLWPLTADIFRAGLIALGAPEAVAQIAVPALDRHTPQTNLPAGLTVFANPTFPPELQALAGLANAPLANLSAASTERYFRTAQTHAFDFVSDGSWRATERFTLTAGLRVVHERITSGYEVKNRAAPSTLGLLLGNSPNAIFAPTPAGRRVASDSATAWDGRLVASYAFHPRLRGYASLSRGRQPASLIVDATSITRLREENLVNHEIGFHGKLAQGRIRWNTAAFLYHYRNFQTETIDPANPTRLILADAGNATGKGFELSAQGAVTENLALLLGYGFVQTTFDPRDATGQPQPFAGFTTRLTPRHSATLGATWRHPLSRGGSVFVSPIFQYTSGRFFEDDNSSFGFTLREGGYGLLNLRAGWTSPTRRWSLRASVDNLLDKAYLADSGNLGASFGLPTNIPGPPRRLRTAVELRW